MRTIKFRLRNQDTKKIVGYEEFVENSGWIYQHVEEKEHYNWMSGVMDSVWIREQFAGLKDKNRKDIYELMKCKGKLGKGNWYYHGIVIFDNGSFCLKITERDGELKDYDIGSTPELNNFDEIEVTNEGYNENPELIKKR